MLDNLTEPDGCQRRILHNVLSMVAFRSLHITFFPLLHSRSAHGEVQSFSSFALDGRFQLSHDNSELNASELELVFLILNIDTLCSSY